MKFCIVLICSIGLQAAEPLRTEPLRLSPQQAIDRALAANPTLKRGRLAVARAEARQAGVGQRKNPELDFTFRQDWLGEDAGEQDIGLAFRQALPITSRLTRARELNQTQVALARAELALARHQLAGQVRLAATRLAVMNDHLSLLAHEAEIHAEMLVFMRKQHKRGEFSMLEVAHAELSEKHLAAELSRQRAAKAEATLALRQLLHERERRPIDVALPDALPDALPAVDTNTLLLRPDILLAQQHIEAARAGLALEQARRYEDLTLGVRIDQERAGDAPEGLQRNTFIGLGLSLPLPFRRPNQAALAGAEVDIKAAQVALDTTIWRAEQERAAALLKRQNAFEQAQLAAGDILALAKNHMADVQAAQAQGQATYLQVQQAHERLVELRHAELETLADYHLAEAKLIQVLGNFIQEDE